MKHCILVGLLLCITINTLPAQEEFSDAAVEDYTLTNEEKAALTALLPDTVALGLEPLEESQFFTSNLYEYINGAADGFHDYDFYGLIVQNYKHGDTEVAVEIYDMKAPLNAFGVYASERSPDYHFIALGAQGHQGKDSLFFLQDRFYIKLVAFGTSEDSTPLLNGVAQSISAKIEKGTSFPKEVSLLPVQDRVPNTEAFIKKSPLGHTYLAPALSAQYCIQGATSTLILSLAESEIEAGERAERFQQYMSKTGKVRELPDLDPRAFIGENQYQGEMIVFPHKTFAAIMLKPSESSVSYLKSWAAQTGGN